MYSPTSNNPILGLLEGGASMYISSFDGTGQYALGGASTCGLAALNAVRIILGRERGGITGVALLERIVSREMADEIAAICARWESQLHLEVDDIFALPLFKNTLVLSYTHHDKAESRTFTALLRRLEETSRKRNSSAAVVITRPPEIFTAFHILTHIRHQSGIFAIFDSHPRPDKDIKGASITLFSRLSDTSDYIAGLLQMDPTLHSESLQWEAQLLSQYSGHIFMASNSYVVDVDDLKFVYDANMETLELKSRLSDVEETNRVLINENTALRERIAKLEDVARVTQARAERSFRAGISNDPPRSHSSAAGPSNREGLVNHSSSLRSYPGVNYQLTFSGQMKERDHGAVKTSDHTGQDEEQANWEAARRIQEELNRESVESMDLSFRGPTHSYSYGPISPIAGPSNYQDTSVRHGTYTPIAGPSHSCVASVKERALNNSSGVNYRESSFSPNDIRNHELPKAADRGGFSRDGEKMNLEAAWHVQEALDRNLERSPCIREEMEKRNLDVARRIQDEMDREHVELSSQMTDLRGMVQVLFECPVCFEMHPEDFVAQVDACWHKLCRGCMTGFVTSKLKENRYPIVCPICQTNKNVKEPGVITDPLVQQLALTEEQYSVWTELGLSQFSVVLDCPKCHCSTFVDIDDHKDMKLLMCPLRGCNYVWCKECHQAVVPGAQHSCDGTLELDGLMRSRGWHYCPGCKTPTEKRSGCNHMTCPARGCNTHFCYICGESIVRSVRQGDVGPALSKHYQRCKLFEY